MYTLKITTTTEKLHFTPTKSIDGSLSTAMGSSIDSARKFDQTWETLNWSFKFSQVSDNAKMSKSQSQWFAGRAYSDNNMLNDEDNMT
jgi:hypothetical protein